MSQSTETQGATCPGAKTLLPDTGGAHYLRHAFVAFYEGAAPGEMILFATRHEFKLSLRGIDALEVEAFELVEAHATPKVMRLAWLSYTTIELSEADVTSLGWRVLPPTP